MNSRKKSHSLNRLVPGFLVIPLLAVSGSLGAAPERVSDFALLDASGNYHQLSRYLHNKALVLMAYDHACEDMEATMGEYKKIAETRSEQDMTFLLLDTSGMDRFSLARLNLPLPILEDGHHLVTDSLQITAAGEVLVLDPQRTSLLFRGAVGESLQSTLALVQDDDAAQTVVTETPGCPLQITRRQQGQAAIPDYVDDVAPVIIENCVECHRQDGVGPFAMDSHIMLLGWSPMIREVLLNRRMPPAQIDPYVTHSEDARYLSPSDIATLISWIDAGAPAGDAESDPLETLDFSGREQWQLGEPDFIVEAPANEVPPTGVMDYIYARAELPHSEEKWLRAVQFMAGDESVLHHLVAYVTEPEEDFWGAERISESATRRFVGAYAPGRISAFEFGTDAGVRVSPGHKLSLQFHYVTNGRATTDATRIGLYFHQQTPRYENLVQALSARFVIPANTSDFPLQASHVFSQDVVVTGLRPHMHFRGKRMKFSAQYPASSATTDLLSVPAYNYGWQPHYRLPEPVNLAAGDSIVLTGAFDNSVSNPNNPDPGREVPFGLESWEEMFTGYITFQRLINP